ncbi:FG-GAP-like repeat-containing protein [Methylohalobius crimeensis]|uniref:FG-GAP-like repeat-containing protein n=1 Tax=Methylohalobius crimeensis TaxID=244365 RepID=UPI0009FBE663|nr:FG-GAP-like repeat-containing protein [Methylohalobius crimeensis]
MLRVGGVAQDFRAFVEPLRSAQRHAVTFDARDLPTGRYPYELMLTSHYPQSIVGSRVAGQVLVNNQRQSPIGAGWQIPGIARLVDTELAGGLLLRAEDGGLRSFRVGANNGELLLPAGVFPVGDTAVSITWGDFNNDGHPDIATSNRKTDDVSILLGNGDGSFQPERRVAAGNGPQFITAHDLNGDGILDFVVTHYFDGVSVLLGNGDGTFQQQPQFAPKGALAVAVADFNGDGIPDLATANGSADDVSVLPGNGNGTFGAEQRFPVGSRPFSIIAVDFNGDGIVDLAVANSSSDDISVLLGNGDGTFQQESRFVTGIHPISIAAEDLNGDTVPDLVTANNAFGDISVFIGNGDGSFREQLNIDAGGGPLGISVEDINGDRVPDLIRANGNSDDISILLGNGDGSFQAESRFPIGNGHVPDGIAVVDINGDGRADIATSNFTSDNVSVLLNQTDPARLSGPAGDFTTIERQPDGTFIRFFPDGSRTHFNAEGLQTSAVDSNGNTTSFAYNGQQHLVSITDPAGLVTQLRYIGDRLSEIEDPAGRITRFAHDGDGNLIRITNPDGSTRQFNYDSQHLLTAQTDERGQVTEYSYDATGRLTMARLPDGAERTITPSRTRALVAKPETTSVANPSPAVLASDVKSRFTDGEGRTQAFKTDQLGRITQRTDPAGLTTIIDRDADGNPTKTAFPDGSVLDATFDPRGNLTSFSDTVRGGSRSFEYEAVFNRPVTATDSLGNTTALAYDERGNLTQLTTPSGRTLALAYDAKGLVTQSTDPLGTVRQFQYNDQGNLTGLIEGEGEQQRITNITYTPEGYVDTITDAEGRTTDFDYDAHGRLTGQTLPDRRVIRLAYDEAGNLVTVTRRVGRTTASTTTPRTSKPPTTHPTAACRRMSPGANTT